MDTREDEELIGLFTQQYQNKEEVRTLKRRNEELEAELKQAFVTLDAQASTIRKYRAILRQSLQPSPAPQPVAQTPPLPPPPPPPPRPIISHVVRAHRSQVYTLAPTEPPSPQRARRSPTPPVAVEPTPAPRSATPAASAPTDLPAPVRCGDLIQDKRIRLLSPDRSDGFKDVYVSTIIWQVIVNFFNQNANANLMDENMIIRECGACLLGDNQKPFLTRAQIRQYFSHPFTFQDSDKTMTVRTRMVQGQPLWMVFIPEWLKSEWRVGGRGTTATATATTAQTNA